MGTFVFYTRWVSFEVALLKSHQVEILFSELFFQPIEVWKTACKIVTATQEGFWRQSIWWVVRMAEAFIIIGGHMMMLLGMSK